MDTLYPHAWEELLLYWKRKLANPILMSLCITLTTTNINESMHQKASIVLHKCKSHSTDRCDFGCKHLVLSQNYGYERSSMMKVFGWVSKHVAKGLTLKDTNSVRSSMRKPKLGENLPNTKHRLKVGKPMVRSAYVGDGAQCAGTGKVLFFNIWNSNIKCNIVK